MVDFENLSDDKLREALSDKGVEVGPITENTRNVYKRKLKRLSTEGVGGAQIKKEGVAIDQVSCDRTNGAGDVILQALFSQLNNEHQQASDTIFSFPDGERLFICRGIVSITNPNLTPLLYTCDELYPVNIVTLMGITEQVWIRSSELGIDLKEKISLKQGIELNEIRLVFDQNVLQDLVTLGLQNITPNVSINIVLVANPLPSPYLFTYYMPHSNPSLSISHLNLGIGLDKLLPFPSPVSTAKKTRVLLQPHIQHIVHVYDVPTTPWKLFIGFLYSGTLPDFSSSQRNPALILASCVVLAQYYQVPLLLETCLYQLHSTLQTDSSTIPILSDYVSQFDCPALRELISSFIKH